VAEVLLSGVRKAYGDVTILKGVDLHIRDGEFMVFVGPSGCGKSTLLRTIAGLEDITSGDLSIGGRRVNDVPPAERGIAMVFQSYALYPHMNLFDNMAFGLKLAGMSQQEIHDAVHRAAKVLHIDHLLDRKPKDLSGGQRQRVAIGRAIVRKPQVFLFDEPLSNLDAALRVRMRYEFAKLHEELKTTMIYVTHDQVEAMTLADRIVVLSAGKVEQVGAPIELYERPCNLFVAGFIGSPKMNFLAGEIVAADAAGAQVKLGSGVVLHATVNAAGAKPGDKVTLGIRPEHLALAGANASGAQTLTAPVTFVEALGSSTQAYVDVPTCAVGTDTPEPFSVLLDGRTPLAAGQALAFEVPPEWCYVFNAEGQAYPRLAPSAGAMRQARAA
jgi:multiple sugar transport system ATP-binding protein